MSKSQQDIVRVLRVVEYVGPRQWVERTVERAIHGTKTFDTPFGTVSIRAATIGTFPEILAQDASINDNPQQQG